MKIIDIIENNKLIKDILKGCPYDILDKWEFKEYQQNEIICYEGMVYNYFYIIVEGYANVYLKAENGKIFSQSIYKSGNYFGELEIFDNKPYICTIEALTDMKVLQIERQYFLEWIKRDRHFSFYITKTLCDNFYDLSKLSGKNTLYSLKYRICNYLLVKLGSEIKNNKKLAINIDKDHLSEQFGVTSRSINRVLKEIKEKNIIDISNKTIYVLDFDALKEEERISKNQ